MYQFILTIRDSISFAHVAGIKFLKSEKDTE